MNKTDNNNAFGRITADAGSGRPVLKAEKSLELNLMPNSNVVYLL